MKLPRGNIKTRLAFARIWEQHRPLIIAVPVILLIAVAGYFAQDLATSRVREARVAEAEETAGRIAKRIAGDLDAALQAARAQVAAADAAAALDDPGQRGSLEQRLAEQNADLMAVRLLPADGWLYDRDPRLPITYTTLEMLEQARDTGKLAPPDAVLFGDPQKHIVALAVLDGPSGTPLGYAVLGLRPDLVQSWVDGLKDVEGYLRIVQPVARGDDILLASLGPERVGESVKKPIPGTRWLAEFIRGGRAADNGSSVGILWSVGVVAVLSALAIAVLLVLRNRKRAGSAPVLGGAAGGFAGTPGAAVDAMVRDYLENSTGDIAEDMQTRPDRTDVRTMEAHARQTVQPEVTDVSTGEVPAEVFRAYDIRGRAGDQLSPDLAHAIGLSIGSEAYDRGQQTLVVARDGRLSSQELGDALIAGIRASGRDVIDIGRVPTPVLYFAASFLETESAVMVTGSHNPKEDNGFKIMLGGETLSEQAIQAIRERMMAGQLQGGDGSLQSMEVDADYIRRVSEDVPVALGKAFKVVIDCGNGVAATMAPRLFRALGHDVVELFCDVDGNFPDHHPDPSQPENLQALIAAVKDNDADIGFAFDGDGDRLGVVDNAGNIIWPDRLMMLFARDVLSRNAGATVVYDIKCTDKLGLVIKKLGGKPEMWRTGHSVIRAKMQETGALLAGDLSGHLFFKDRWYGYDDAMYAGARLLEVLQGIGGRPADIFARLPGAGATPELLVPVTGNDQHGFMQRLKAAKPDFEGGQVNALDGLRVHYPDGWGLVRASNTTAVITLRFEAANAEALARIQGIFRKVLLSVDDSLVLPF